ncbi:MAG: CPBP family intramembrane metalloprotease [Rubripirellula sp.]|nr:CPBP family intramembrane metalloprotease [Rubripirellula sp.]
MTEITRLLIQSLMFAILVSGLVGWWRVLRFWRKSVSTPIDAAIPSSDPSPTTGIMERLVPARRQNKPFWTPAEFLLAFGLRVVLMIGLSSLFIKEASSTHAPLLVQLAAIVLAIAAMLGWLSLLQRDAPQRVGFQIQKDDLKLGLISTPLILSVVMLISLLASSIVEYEHPVLKSLFANKSILFYILTFLTTAIATPIYEEFLFRGLLQGSLQALANPTPTGETWKPLSVWPLIVSSLIFAAMHFPGQGAAPIPIFVLSLGLGYLYRQTGSLAAPILVHVILNSITLLDAFTAS